MSNSTIEVDLRDFEGWARAVSRAPDDLNYELTEANRQILHEGIGYARENAPAGSGDLRGDIRVFEGPTAEGGSYGTDLAYSYIREEGGTIYPRNKKALAFQLAAAVTPSNPEGWVFAKKVTQKGTKYMERSAETMEPRAVTIYEGAVKQALREV